MNEKLKEKVKESLSSVLPITLIVLVLRVTLDQGAGPHARARVQV